MLQVQFVGIFVQHVDETSKNGGGRGKQLSKKFPGIFDLVLLTLIIVDKRGEQAFLSLVSEMKMFVCV